MAGKPLNKQNLLDLGADSLADLVLELVKGDSARKRHVRMLLSSTLGMNAAAAEARKRIATVRRSKGKISPDARRKLQEDLIGLTGSIESIIAPDDPNLAFELLWSLFKLMPGVTERLEQYDPAIYDVVVAVMTAVENLAPRLTIDPVDLADTVYEAIIEDVNGGHHGEIESLGEALGKKGFARLRSLAEDDMDAPFDDLEAERSASGFSEEDWKYVVMSYSGDKKTQKILKDVADQQDDVDAWLSQYTPEQLLYRHEAEEAAGRLLKAGRHKEALKLVEKSLAGLEERGHGARYDNPELDEIRSDCLEALGRHDELRADLWENFTRALCVKSLRRYLDILPDSEGEEALKRVRDVIMGLPNMADALKFCMKWPDLELAAALVAAREGHLDCDHYEPLTDAAKALAPEHPLESVILLRSLILFALANNREQRFKTTARHMNTCAKLDSEIQDHGSHRDHAAFERMLRDEYGDREKFWRLVDK